MGGTLALAKSPVKFCSYLYTVEWIYRLCYMVFNPHKIKMWLKRISTKTLLIEDNTNMQAQANSEKMAELTLLIHLM